MSTNLNFKTHTNRISSNANKSLGFINRIIKTKHTGVREAAYKTIVRPQLEYTSKVFLYTDIEMLQRRAIRCTLNNYSSYDSVSNLGWRSLDQRRTVARLCMLYTIVRGLVAIQLPPYFQQPSRMTRHSHLLALRQIHTSVNFYKYSFSPVCCYAMEQVASRCCYAAYIDSIQCGRQVS